MKNPSPSREELAREVTRLRQELARIRGGAEPGPEQPPPPGEPAALQLEKMFAALPDVVLSLDGEGRYLKVLARRDELLAARPEELEGKLIRDFLDPEAAELCLAVIAATIESGKEQTVEYRLETLEGWKWFEGRTAPLPEADGTIEKVLWIAREVTARKDAEEAVKNALKQKDLLLKELYHRVNNNLQIIISLLKLQSEYAPDGKTRALLRRNRDRISSMALIHEILYSSQDLNRIDFGRYLETLGRYFFEQYSPAAAAVKLETEAGEISLDINTAIPCGLFLNELLSASLEAPAASPPRGTIRIGILSRQPDRIEIFFARRGENFPDIPPDPDTTSFGLELIQTLADQLGGRLETTGGDWTTWKIAFAPAEQRVGGEESL